MNKTVFFISFLLLILSSYCGNKISPKGKTITEQIEVAEKAEQQPAKAEKEVEEKKQSLPEEIIFDRYCNARYAYCISYPSQILIPQGESDNGDGQFFLSDDQKQKLSVWGEMNIFDESLKEKMETVKSEIENIKSEINETYFVIKGTKGDKEYYRLTMIIPDGFVSFVLEYTENKEILFAPIIEEMKKSFKQSK